MRSYLKAAGSLLLCIVLLAACGGTNRSLAVGGRKDAHGCLAAAGYTWSAVRHDCIRIFEAGVQLLDSRNPDAVLAAYAVFSDDGAQAELFLPAAADHPVLTRRADGRWQQGRYVLCREAGRLVLTEGGERIYHEK